MDDKTLYPLEFTAKSWAELQKIITLVYMRFNYKIHGVSVSAKDTEFHYKLFVYSQKGKIKKADLQTVYWFVVGAADCFRMG